METDIERQLQKKDETIAALKKYLNQAAARLEKMQRGEQASSVASGAQAFPPELVERQSKLGAKLEEIVAAWESRDMPEAIEKAVAELAGIRQLIADRFREQDDEQPPPPHHSHHLPMDGEVPGRTSSSMESWELLKAQMLQDTGVAAEDVSSEAGAVDLAEDLAVLANRPETPRLSDLTAEAGREAVDVREQYIISLIRTLRAVHSRHRSALRWLETGAPPEDAKQRLEELETKLQQKLRTSEVELSLERARLSRKESELRQRENQIAKARKQRDEGHSTAAKHGSESPQNSRWRRFLGRGKDS